MIMSKIETTSVASVTIESADQAREYVQAWVKSVDPDVAARRMVAAVRWTREQGMTRQDGAATVGLISASGKVRREYDSALRVDTWIRDGHVADGAGLDALLRGMPLVRFYRHGSEVTGAAAIDAGRDLDPGRIAADIRKGRALSAKGETATSGTAAEDGAEDGGSGAESGDTPKIVSVERIMKVVKAEADRTGLTVADVLSHVVGSLGKADAA